MVTGSMHPLSRPSIGMQKFFFDRREVIYEFLEKIRQRIMSRLDQIFILLWKGGWRGSSAVTQPDEGVSAGINIDRAAIISIENGFFKHKLGNSGEEEVGEKVLVMEWKSLLGGDYDVQVYILTVEGLVTLS